MADSRINSKVKGLNLRTEKEIEAVLFDGSDDDGCDSASEEDFSDICNMEDFVLDVDNNIEENNPNLSVYEDPDAELNRLLNEFEDVVNSDATNSSNNMILDDDIENVRSTSTVSQIHPSTSQIDNSTVIALLSTGDSKKIVMKKTQPSKDKKITNMKWKNQNFLSVPVEKFQFKGNTELPNDVQELCTPLQFFNYFITPDLVEHIVYETNLYSTTIDITRPANIKGPDIYKYIGICLMSTVVQCKNFRTYWNRNCGYPPIQESLTLNRFERIRQVLHFNNNANQKSRNEEGYDRLFKVRPLIETLKQRFLSIPMGSSLAIDEQMCATKAHSSLKMYIPSKPHKYGYKIYILAGENGFCHDFEIYTGETHSLERGEKNIGESSNVIVRLSRAIPKQKGYKLYFDNYFNSVALQVFLYNQGILSLGTVRRNRLPNCQLPDDHTMNKKDRGTIVSRFSRVKQCPLFLTAWKDTKVVTLLSTFVGADPIGTSRRYNRKDKFYVNVPTPAVIREYNKNMGFVDLMDSYIGRYRIILRSRKWYFRIFYHFIDIATINAWLLFKKTTNSQMKLIDFRAEVAMALMQTKMTTTALRKPGRPRESLLPPVPEKRRALKQPIPVPSARFDAIDHWPVFGKKNRCKNVNCSGFSVTQCEKCKVTLCYTAKKNCFRNYHLK